MRMRQGISHVQSPIVQELWAKLTRNLTWEWQLSEWDDLPHDGDVWEIEGLNPKDGRRYGVRIFVPHHQELHYGTRRVFERVLEDLLGRAEVMEVEGRKSLELLVAEALMED